MWYVVVLCVLAVATIFAMCSVAKRYDDMFDKLMEDGE